MYHKNSGDDIASTFQKLLSKKIQKTAAEQCHTCGDMVDDGKMEDHLADHKQEDEAKDMRSVAEDMLMDSEEAGTQDNLLAEEISMLDDAAYDEHSKEARIMRGLGKIAASLRSKGEVFASDVVEATARSINEDFKKEASEKNRVTRELQKVARNMRIEGKEKGARMVEKTIKDIKR